MACLAPIRWRCFAAVCRILRRIVSILSLGTVSSAAKKVRIPEIVSCFILSSLSERGWLSVCQSGSVNNNPRKKGNALSAFHPGKDWNGERNGKHAVSMEYRIGNGQGGGESNSAIVLYCIQPACPAVACTHAQQNVKKYRKIPGFRLDFLAAWG